MSVATGLEKSGVRVLVVAREGPSAEVDRIARERGLTLPIFYDVNASMRLGFGNFGTPEYYIVDRAGRIRFHVGSLAQLALQVEAVR